MHAETFAYMLHNLDYERKTVRARPLTVPAAVPPWWTSVGARPLGREQAKLSAGITSFRHSITLCRSPSANTRFPTGNTCASWSGRCRSAFLVSARVDGFTTACSGRFRCPRIGPCRSRTTAAAYADWAGNACPPRPNFTSPPTDPLAIPGRLDAARDNFDFQAGTRFRSTPRARTSSEWSIGGQWLGMDFHAVQPFPGFEPFPFYPGYSANFFDGEHYVLKGASPRTAASMTGPPSAIGSGARIRTPMPRFEWRKLDVRATLHAVSPL